MTDTTFTDFLKAVSETSEVEHQPNTLFDVFIKTITGGLEDTVIARVCADSEEEAIYLAIIGESYQFGQEDEDAADDLAFVKKSFQENLMVTDDSAGMDLSVTNIIPLQSVEFSFNLGDKVKSGTIHMPITDSYPSYIMDKYIT